MADNFDPEVMRKFIESLSDASRQADEVVQGQRKEKEERDKNIKAIQQFGTSLAGASKQLGKAMVDASDSAGKYAGGIESAGNAAYDLGKNFGALGTIAGGLVSIFTKLVGASLRQQDALLKTYRTLSQFGDLDNSSFKGILSDLQSTGFAVNQNAERYVEAIRKVAPELSIFSGSVSEGRKQLVSTFRTTLGQTEKQLARFGYSTEEMFEKTGSMISQMALTSNKNSISTAKLNAMSVTYMETLAGLADLTGQSRDALEEQRKQQLNDLRWQMYLADVQAKFGPARVEAEKNQLLMMETMYGKDKAQGYISKVVNFGRTVDDSAVRFNRMFGQTGYNKFREGLTKSGDQVVNFANTAKEVSPMVKRQFQMMKNYTALGNDLGKELGHDIETYRGVMLGENVDPVKFQQQLDKKKDAAANTDIDAYTARMQKERQIRIAYENMLQDMGPKVQNALGKFVEIIWKTAKRLAQILKKIGGPDYTDAFRDVEDVTADLTETLKRYNKISAELAEKQRQVKNAPDKTIERQLKSDIEGLEKKQKIYAGIALKLRGEHAEKGGGDIKNFDDSLTRKFQMQSGQQPDGPPKGKPGTVDMSRHGEVKPEDIINFTGNTGSRQHFERMEKGAQDAFLAMAYEYNKTTGKKLQINSAHRTPQEQAAVNSGGNPKAEPGTSMHERGTALDLNSNQVRILKEYGFLRRYGFSPLEGDPPHINFTGAANGGYFNGPNSGYLVEQHGPEATFNPKQLKALNNALTKTPISGGGSPTGQDVAFMELMTRISGVMESIANLQRDSNSIQEEILKYAKA